jgi:hypothetical protein
MVIRSKREIQLDSKVIVMIMIMIAVVMTAAAIVTIRGENACGARVSGGGQGDIQKERRPEMKEDKYQSRDCRESSWSPRYRGERRYTSVVRLIFFEGCDILSEPVLTSC